MINKNVNGTNKLERQKNKAKKYLNIELVDQSNTYWKIDTFDSKDTFILFTNFRIVKNGDLAILEPLNRIKEYFKKTFSVIYEERPYYYSPFIIFKSYGEQQHKELMDIVAGYEDLYLLSDWIKNNNQTPNKMLIKKITSGFVNESGKFFKTKAKELEAKKDKETEIEELIEELD